LSKFFEVKSNERKKDIVSAYYGRAIMIIAGISCKKHPVCERDNTGFAKIYNNTGVIIKVKIYSANYPGNGFLAERTIDIEQTTIYDDVPSGPVEILGYHFSSLRYP
jgi:hypothetical protein